MYAMPVIQMDQYKIQVCFEINLSNLHKKTVFYQTKANN